MPCMLCERGSVPGLQSVLPACWFPSLSTGILALFQIYHLLQGFVCRLSAPPSTPCLGPMPHLLLDTFSSPPAHPTQASPPETCQVCLRSTPAGRPVLCQPAPSSASLRPSHHPRGETQTLPHGQQPSLQPVSPHLRPCTCPPSPQAGLVPSCTGSQDSGQPALLPGHHPHQLPLGSASPSAHLQDPRGPSCNWLALCLHKPRAPQVQEHLPRSRALCLWGEGGREQQSQKNLG